MIWHKPTVAPDKSFGWYLGILKPIDYEDCDNKNSDYTDWMVKFGLEKIWYNNRKFWQCDQERTHPAKELGNRLLAWSMLPDLREDIVHLSNGS
ncbi:MAG: hypothetical protein DRI46_10475 [Chloroflexi bacterium]|nr:MAG: hypothetical protein DRI46_10475 [Chloroflexota bacterium]